MNYYLDLFLATLPETALELAALLVLVVDLSLLRHAQRATRITVAAVLGVLGCGLSLLMIPIQPGGGFIYPELAEWCWQEAARQRWRRLPFLC